ncbi:rotatin isoform X1 [Xyrauchen texanus]|uniref:rotatin isoform X1 n=1 Tax=Xyrauchen texanus TaxID=154827 RepID=UPI002241BD50|nr:rotatin isoform X1 [Xyrauchen texanus]
MTMELSSLFKKIGHSLVEIRVRALKNIRSKLDHGLISTPDLVQERMLFVFLLEWFNFPEVPMQEEVLELISTLSRHPTGAQMLQDVGAVEFLTQLSPNVDPRLRTVVDGIFDQLFHLPEVLPSCPPTTSYQSYSVPLLQTEEDSSARGYFQCSKPKQTDAPNPGVSVSTSIRCLKFSVFPWLSLNTTDRHILSSNESSLRCDNHTLVRTTCELLRDVIMQDFPAEIFLQRPSTVQSLLSLLGMNVEGDVSYLTFQALACLEQLCRNLRSRLRFYRDSSFCSAKQDPISQNSSISYSQEVRGTQQSGVTTPEECSPRPSVVGRPGQRVRGDGQDGDAASSSGSSSQIGAPPRPTQRSPLPQPHLELPPEMEAEESLELQLQQWSLARFSVAAVEHALLLIRTNSLKVFQRALELLAEAQRLLGDSVAPEVWDEHSLAASELREKLQACIETLGDVICYHHGMTSSEQSDSSLIHHRMAFVGTGIFTIRLLQTLLPVEKAGDNIPESTVAAIFLLCLDTSFSVAYPSIHESAVAYLEQACSERYSLYRRVSCASNCMEATCTFLKDALAEGDKNWHELLELADQAIDAFPYHQHLPVVKECIQICSYLWKFAQASPLLQSLSQKIFLKLLSHPLSPVKAETYSCTLSILKESLGVQNVARPTSSICSSVHFLLHSHVLYEISVFGLQDQAREVSSAAKDILLYLLKGGLMMTTTSWSRFNEALYPVIPVLQSYAGTEDALGNCILLISDASAEKGDEVRSPTARLRASLRLLFTKHHTVRNTAVQQLLPHVTSAEGASTSRPALDSSTLSSLSSLYVLNKIVDVKLNNSDKSYVKVESVNKLYNILTSETVDIVLRKSSAEQLAVILQDPSMHSVLKALGLPDTLISFIMESVNNNVVGMDCLLEPSVCMLRKLVFADPSLRHSLALQTSLLITLLKASLLIKENKGDVSEAAALMCMLLFDEIARMDVWTDKASSDTGLSPFSLPSSVIRRYNLPFQAPAHHAVSPYCSVLPPYSDLLNLKPAWEALQITWNRAWYSGTDGLLEHLRGFRSDVPEFHSDLVLSETQAMVLRLSNIRSGLQDCVHAVRDASSHSAVTFAVTRMHLYLLIDRLALKPTAQSSKSILQTLSWHSAVERFLMVRPACHQDERLLVDIVSFLNTFFRQNQSESDHQDLKWFLELLLNQESHTLLNLLLSGDSQTYTNIKSQEVADELHAHLSHRLQRELTGLFNTLLLRLTHTSDRMSELLSGPFASELSLRLLQGLRLSDAPRFYGLPSLERTLRTMAHVTALPGWSTKTPSIEPQTLCLKYLSGLLEVISSFYVDLGGNSMSFMGKGVTKNAVICLLHLSHEMMKDSKNEDWISLWSLGREQSSEEQSAAQLGLAWLIPLWVDRDPEVRCASLAVGAALSSLERGCVALSASCQNISGGLWATVLNILLEKQECSMVRREAAFILQNLLVMPMPANAEEAKEGAWQSPCVHDEDSGLCLVGLPALQALLYHCQFFESIAQMVKCCYTGRQAFTLSPPPPPDNVTQDTDLNDSLKHWRRMLAPLNQSQGSGSISTSSTLITSGSSSGTHSPFPTSSAVQDIPVNRLTAQGQSDTDSSDSALSQESHPAGRSEPVAIATPQLLLAVCGLLDNLLAVLPEFSLLALKQNQILESMVSVVDAAVIAQCVNELRTPLLSAAMEDARHQMLTSVYYVQSLCKLLQSAAMHSEDLPFQQELFKPLLNNLISILTLPVNDLDVQTQGAVLHTWADVLMLLATLLYRNQAAVGPSVGVALGKHWQRFSDTVQVCLEHGGAESPIYTSAMQFLCVLFTEESKRRSGGHKEDQPSSRSTLTAVLSSEPGEAMCKLLLERYEKIPFPDPLKKVTAKALMSLLACSPSAQSYACKAGVIDSCLERMKNIYAELHLESVKASKRAHRRKQVENSMRELKMILEILRNCLYQHNECKVVATELRLAVVLMALWPWILLDDPSMMAALELLCVYTANCTAACSALCSNSSSGGSVESVLPKTITNSLMHGVMKLASQVAPDNRSIHSLAFSLLANLAISRDCKGVLQKSNFLQHFLSLPMRKTGGRSGGPAVELLSLWLRLLLNVSFGEDGQQMILRLRGALELLVELAQSKHSSCKPTILLILHNICFCSANKPKVLANDKAVEMLVSCLSSSSSDVRTIGASALWALLHNNQKAKATLKCPSIRLKLEEAFASARKDAEQSSDKPLNAYLLKCLRNLTQIFSS